MKLTTCLHQFFSNYLPHIKGVSQHTIRAYRDAFTLFIPFAANRLKIKTGSLMLAHLTPDMVLAFLVDLEQKRQNTPVTRNHRLAAIKSLAKMIRFMHPEKKDVVEKILAIPQKRYQRKLIGFLYPDEIFKVMQSVDLYPKEGFRDYCLLVLLYDSGARATEVATLNLDYFNPEQRTLVILGKGNRFRQITLMPETSILIKNYASSDIPVGTPKILWLASLKPMAQTIIPELEVGNGHPLAVGLHLRQHGLKVCVKAEARSDSPEGLGLDTRFGHAIVY